MMKIRLSFIALESDHLPDEGEGELQLREGAGLLEALRELGVSEDSPVLTLVNEASVPVSERGKITLSDGDTLTLFSPIKGG